MPRYNSIPLSPLVFHSLLQGMGEGGREIIKKEKESTEKMKLQRKNIVRFVFLYIAFIVLLMPSFGFAQTDVFITTDELSSILGQPNVVIVDGRFKEQYEANHIPGAVNLNYEAVEKLRDPSFYKEMKAIGLPIRTEKAEALFSSFGIGNDSKVVLYDNPPDRSAGFLLAALKILGANDVRILKGGIKEWRKKKLPTNTDPPQIKPAAFKVNSKTALVATAAYIVKNMKDIQLLDARTGQEYAGLGSIPGTINIEWKNFADAKVSIKPIEEIQKVLNEAGITKDKEIVVYCNSGSRAGLPFVALMTAGYKVRLYWGSMDEWKEDSNLPLIKK